MPAEIGEMFYTGELPWHGEGIELAKAATLEEALKVGGLDWQVGTVDLMTADDPPSPVLKRKAIVRLDRQPGDETRVLGVAHRGFQPVQNRDGAMLFDAIFGHGKPVYQTGGYLGNGEVVWLLAQIDRPLEISPGDVVQPYALFSNSHDGSMALHIRLTTIRVVCRNTLTVALQDGRFGQQFRRAHQGSLRDHAEAAQRFFGETLRELDSVAEAFTELTKHNCSESDFLEIVTSLLPEPKKPRNAEQNPGLLKVWQNRVEYVRSARKKITELRETGRGMDLPGSRGTYWGVLNAILEYVDHHQENNQSAISNALLGDGMKLKQRAFSLIGGIIASAA